MSDDTWMLYKAVKLSRAAIVCMLAGLVSGLVLAGWLHTLWALVPLVGGFAVGIGFARACERLHYAWSRDNGELAAYLVTKPLFSDLWFKPPRQRT